METYWAKQYKIRKLKAIAYKGGKCQRCGYDKCVAALDFHHRDPSEKEFQWVRLRRLRWDRVLAELDKCDLLCANCHREVHYDPTKWEVAVGWRAATDARKLQPLKCRCGTIFVPANGTVQYCSKKCAREAREVVQWPVNLPELVKASSLRAVAKELKVSDKSVARRLMRHHESVTHTGH